MTIKKQSLNGVNATRRLIEQLDRRVSTVQNGVISASAALTPHVQSSQQVVPLVTLSGTTYVGQSFTIPTVTGYSNILMFCDWIASSSSSYTALSGLFNVQTGVPVSVGNFVRLDNGEYYLNGTYSGIVSPGDEYSVHAQLSDTNGGVSSDFYNWTVNITLLYLL